MLLARCSRQQRIIVAGSRDGAELMFELHRRGYVRVRTTIDCGVPGSQYDAALLDCRGRSIKAIESTLDWLVSFLAPQGVLVVLVDPQQPAANRNLRFALERHGLVVEAGTIHQHGCAVSARRSEIDPLAKVAQGAGGGTLRDAARRLRA